MISTLIPFDEIIENVKDDTAITNLSNAKEKIRRWIFRAQQQLGYNSTRVYKTVKYVKDTANWTGKKLYLPSDCLELQDIYIDDTFVPENAFRQYGNHVTFNNTYTEGAKLQIFYYGMLYDGEGNPACQRNHSEALVAFIIWKMFGAKTFLEPNRYGRRLTKDYEQDWKDYRDAAIGNEAMPANLEGWEQLSSIINFSTKDAIIYYPRGYEDNTAILEAKETCVLKKEELDVNVYAWQYDSLTLDIGEAPSISQTFLDTVDKYSLDTFKEGQVIPYNKIGRIGFAIQGAPEKSYAIYDTFNSDVTDLVFDRHYNSILGLDIYISKTFYSHSNIFFKLKDI